MESFNRLAITLITITSSLFSVLFAVESGAISALDNPMHVSDLSTLTDIKQDVCTPATFIYHYNGSLAWNGDEYSSFFHDNAQVAWGGFHHPKRDFFFHNGQRAWKGFVNKERSYSYEPCTVYHSNGNKVWKGATSKETTFTYGPSTIFHNNGQIAWKGVLYKECSFTSGPSTVYYGNGKKAWRGALSEDCSYSSKACTIYHACGKVAWRGSFAENNSSSDYYSGVFYDNDQLAWSGRRGDPLYNRDGSIQSSSIEAILLHLGEGSSLYVSHEGSSVFNLSLGDGSFLRFSNQNENPILQMHLGPGYFLTFFPHSGETPKFSLFNMIFDVNYVDNASL